MRFHLWEVIPPTTTVGVLLSTSVLIHADHPQDGVVATFERGKQEQVTVVMRFARTNALDSWGMLNFEPGDTIGPHVRDFLPGRRVRIVAVPPVRWKQLGRGLRCRTPAVIISALGAAIATLLISTSPQGAFAALPLAALVAFLVWNMLRRIEPTRIMTAGDLRLDGSNIVEYAQRRQLGERPQILRVQERRDRIVARMADIKAEYGRLELDIVYRINNSALFDSSVPAIERFQTALILWDEATGRSLDELDAQAADLEIAFSVARDNAETLGLFHLPETARSDARRAAKAARLAAGSTNEGERDASLHQVARILDSLALYYLPTVQATELPIDPPRRIP